MLIGGLVEIIKKAVADGIILGLKNLGITITIAHGSYWICLGGAMISLFLYIGGLKKAVNE